MKRIFDRSKSDVGSPPYCSFCGKGSTRRRRVTRRADSLYICDECVDRVIEALSHSDLEKHLAD